MCIRDSHWAAHVRVEIRLNPFQLEAGRAAYMEVGVESSFAAVNHQNLHLPHGKVLDVILAGSGFLRLALASHAGLGVLAVSYTHLDVYKRQAEN